MSHYADYLRERTTDLIYETDYGFATYRFLGDKTVYIVDIYVEPLARKHGHAKMMADMVKAEAKAMGCTEMLGTVVPTCKGATESLKVLLAYGMRLHESRDNLILCKKEI